MFKHTLAYVSELPVTKTVPLALYAQHSIRRIWGLLLAGVPLVEGPLLLPEDNLSVSI